MDLRNSEQLLRVVFSTFGGQRFFLKFFFDTWKKKEFFDTFESNAERGSIESMSIALGI